MSVSKRLSKVFGESSIITFDDSSRFVIMSDCHRGIGNWGDNFSNNQNLFFAALNYYYENGFTYIELGDGDELWENRDINDVISTHSDAFWLMSLLYKDNRLLMLYGNHDIVKRDSRFSKTNCNSFYCETVNSQVPLFPGIEFPEGLVLQYHNSAYKVLLTHGHQADFQNDTLWRLSRFLVRYLWRPLELIGIKDPTSASKNNKNKNDIEEKLKNWVEQNKHPLICGHTHRTAFPGIGEVPYFNDGSCVHPRCITALEIRNGTISLVKWAVLTRPDRTLYVGREVLDGPVRVMEYFRTQHYLRKVSTL